MEEKVRPLRIKWVWDNEPEYLFGQVWMSVCPHCNGGPINHGTTCCLCGKPIIWIESPDHK